MNGHFLYAKKCHRSANPESNRHSRLSRLIPRTPVDIAITERTTISRRATDFPSYSCNLRHVSTNLNPGIRRSTAAAGPPSSRKLLIAMISALALFAALSVLTLPVQQEQRNRGIHLTLFAEVLPFAFLLFPYLVAFVLAAWGNTKELRAAGAGIALVLFGGFVLISPAALMMIFLWAGLSRNPMLGASLVVVVLLMANSVWIVWSALRQRKNSPGALAAGACATAIYLFVGFPALRLKEFRAQQHAESIHAAATLDYYSAFAKAHNAVALLAGCLIQQQASQPKSEFPGSLSEIPQGPGCDNTLAKPGAIPYYTLTYAPQRDSSGRIDDFQLSAIPIQKGLDRVNPILCDKRGTIFVYERWFAMDQGEKLVPLIVVEPNDFTASQLFTLRNQINAFIKSSAGANAPSSLSQIVPPTADGQTTDPGSQKAGPYILKYLPPRKNDPSRYAISATCQNYTDACMRSFLLDYDGRIRQTAEARPATSQDPLLADCDKFGQTCRDVEWPIPSPAEISAH